MTAAINVHLAVCLIGHLIKNLSAAAGSRSHPITVPPCQNLCHRPSWPNPQSNTSLVSRMTSVSQGPVMECCSPTTPPQVLPAGGRRVTRLGPRSREGDRRGCGRFPSSSSGSPYLLISHPAFIRWKKESPRHCSQVLVVQKITVRLFPTRLTKENCSQPQREPLTFPCIV